MTEDPGFKGYIHDVGGPTANFRHPACKKQETYGACKDRQCLYPKPCKNLKADHRDYRELLRRLRALPGVKKVFIRSGIRFDYMLADPDPSFLRELCTYHVSGQLKVAPEHVSDKVLSKMGKPSRAVYEQISILHLLPFLPVCIIPAWIQEVWRRSMCPGILTRRPCNGR